MTRQDVEDRLAAEGVRFVDSGISDKTELGSVQGQPICNPTRVYLAVDFVGAKPNAPSANDVLTDVRLSREPGACL
jgi:hypothetical protein